MPVTLMVTKDGRQVPLKISIWDAFKGIPAAQKRHSRCSCCNGRSAPAKKELALVRASAVESDAKKISDTVTLERPTTGAGNVSEFTAEEDAKIKEMKAESPTRQWKVVADALETGKSGEECKARYKVLQDSDKEGKKQKGCTERATDEQVAAPGTENEVAVGIKADEGLKLTKAQKRAKKHAARKHGETSNEAGTAATNQTAKGVKCTPKIELGKPLWIAAASKYFDRTGIRITPDHARQMAAETS